jgi:hypothetical protein
VTRERQWVWLNDPANTVTTALPESESPTVPAEWDELLVTLRQSVLTRGEIGLLWLFGQAAYGRDDLEVFERLVGVLPRCDPATPWPPCAACGYGPG